MSNLSDILGNPGWIPHSLDAANQKMAFAFIPQSKREELTFLADFRPSSDKELRWVTLDELITNAPAQSAVHFLFHSAFCRSTLLVQAIGALRSAQGLSEPMVLNHLQSVSRAAKPLIAPVCSWLARSSNNARVTVLKPSNFANGLIPEFLGQVPDAKAIILTGDLAAFLRSVAKKGLGGRIWARRQLAHCRSIMPIDLGIDERGFYELTDLQCAGLAWLFQMHQFDWLARDRRATIRTLASDEFIANKKTVLTACVQWLEIEASDDEIDAVCQSALFSSHAKLGGEYDAIQAAQTKAADSEVIAEEISKIEQWIEVLMQRLNLSLAFPAPLRLEAT